MGNVIERAVGDGVRRWVDCFESEDPKGCATCYAPNAMLIVDPYGVFRGHVAIAEFWEDLARTGHNDIAFIHQRIDVIDDLTARRSTFWTMNRAYGTIGLEIWVMQANGLAVIAESHFEMAGSVHDARERAEIEGWLRRDAPRASELRHRAV